ncbi:MAG: sigma factor-like helix-turn-helix DNA-binding protein [Acidimicrobiales bacterium]
MTEFEPWYEREHPRVLAACRALGADADAAREATDEAFTRALERWPRVRQMGAPGGWAQVVALNQLRRVLRRRRLEELVPSLRLRSSAVWVDPPLPDAELWASVAGLPHRQRVAVVLRYLHDLPEADIARVMGVARGTVASTLSAAHLSLGRRMSEPVTTKEPSNG